MKKTLACILLASSLMGCSKEEEKLSAQKFIDSHPQQSQEITQLYLQQEVPTKQMYLLMFDHIRTKAEERPELMEHFGPIATSYMEQQTVDKYVGAVEGSILDTAEKVSEQTRTTIEMFGRVKQYWSDEHGNR